MGVVVVVVMAVMLVVFVFVFVVVVVVVTALLFLFISIVRFSRTFASRIAHYTFEDIEGWYRPLVFETTRKPFSDTTRLDGARTLTGLFLHDEDEP